MHLPESSRMQGDQGGGNRLGDDEIAAVGNPHLAALCLPGGRTGAEGEGEGMWRRTHCSFHGRLVCGEGAREFALEDVKLVERDLREYLGRHPEIFGQYVRRRVREPIRDQERVIFRGLAIVET